MSSLLWKMLLGAGGGAAAVFDPSSVSGYTRDWDFNYVTNLTTDTGGTTPVTADGDPIGTILCRAGSTVRLVAPADASRPTYKTAIQNGKSVGRFDGSDDYISHATAITADASQTIFLVVKKRSAPTAAYRMVFALDAEAVMFASSSEHATNLRYYANSSTAAVTLGAVATSWNIIALKFATVSSCTHYTNGGAGTTFNPHDDYSTSTALYLAAAADGTQDGDYDIGRVLIYSAALSNADLDTVFSGLGAEWGITVTAVS